MEDNTRCIDPERLDTIHRQNAHRKPNEESILSLRKIRQASLEFALVIERELRDGEQKRQSLARLEEARMWACSGAVAEGKVDEPLDLTSARASE